MSAKATSNSAVNRNLNSWRQQVNKSAKTCSVKETGSCTFCHLDRWMTRLLVIPLNVFYFYQLRTSILSPVPLLSIVFISVSCTESHSYSTSNSNEFFLVHLIFFSSQLPSFYSSWYLLCVFVLTSVWLVEDVVQRRVSGHWRTFRSQQERVYGGPLGSCVRTHTQANSHKFNHTPVLSSQIPLKESHSHKATERKTKRWNVFSLSSPFHLFLSYSGYSLQSFSAVQYKHAEWSKSLGVSEARDKMDVCRRQDKKRSWGNTAVNQTFSQTPWSFYPSGTPVDFWAYLHDHQCIKVATVVTFALFQGPCFVLCSLKIKQKL